MGAQLKEVSAMLNNKYIPSQRCCYYRAIY